MKQLCMSVVVELPTDLLEAAGLTFKLSEPWLALCQALKDAGIKHETKLDELEVRARPGRPRKPRTSSVGEVRGILREPGSEAA